MPNPVTPLSLAYYLSLITSQYKTSPKFIAWVTALLQLLEDANFTGGQGWGMGPFGAGPWGIGLGSGSVFSLVESFDLDLAIGNQLDILGVIVGVSRQVDFQTAFGNLPSFGVDLNNGAVAGFDTGFLLGFTKPILSDDTYRLLIKAKIAQNNWDGQATSLYAIWKNLFPSGLIQIIDNEDMSATVILAGSFDQITKDLISNGLIVPRPQAVHYSYVFAKLPIFGVDGNGSFVSGFDTGFVA